MKKCFIALDIDGVLNSRNDHLLMTQLDNDIEPLQPINSYSYEEQQNHFSAMIEQTFPKMWKFAQRINGQIDLGNYVNFSKLLLLNAWIDNMLSKGYEIHVLGISSWFKFDSNHANNSINQTQSNHHDNSNQLNAANCSFALLLNTSHDEAKRFFEFNSEVMFEYAENTTGIGEIRYEQFIQYINQNLNQSKIAKSDDVDLVMLYLDDTKIDIDFTNDNQFTHQYLKDKVCANNNCIKPNYIQLFIPNIEGRIGLIKEHLPDIK